MGSASLAAHLAQEIADGRWSEGEPLPGVRRIAREVGCSPGTAARSYTALRDGGVLAGIAAVAVRGRRRRRRASGALGRRRPGPAARRAATIPRSTCSCARWAALSRWSPGRAAVCTGWCSSRAARSTPRRCTCSTSPAAVGTTRWRAARSAASRSSWCTCGGASRAWWSRAATRTTSESVEDLAGRRVAWRPPGTGSRLLLERLMREAGCVPRPELGEPADSHLAVAAAVATGAADAGLAVRAVAESAGLDWVPVASEPFELALDPASRAAVEPLLDVLAQPRVQDAACGHARLRPVDERRGEGGGVRRAAAAAPGRLTVALASLRRRRRRGARSPPTGADDPRHHDEHARLRAARRAGARLRGRVRLLGQDGRGRAPARRSSWARSGDADVLLVHSPEAEEEFMAAGHGASREAVMHNDFVLVGPPGDPADIAGAGDAADALARIAKAEAAFASRADESGTHTKELSLWETAGHRAEGLVVHRDRPGDGRDAHDRRARSRPTRSPTAARSSPPTTSTSSSSSRAATTCSTRTT